jgi:hypothetical protein
MYVYIHSTCMYIHSTCMYIHSFIYAFTTHRSLLDKREAFAQAPFISADNLYSSLRRVHPLGKEAKFSESLRGQGTGFGFRV